MGNIIDECLKFEIQQNYLKVDSKLFEKITQYEIDMINNNQASRFISIDVEQFNENVNLFYSLDSKVSLSEALLKRQISQSELIIILKNIIKIVQDCKVYFLDDRKLIFNLQYMYIGANNLNIYMVYIPTEMTLYSNANNEVKSLLSTVVRNYAATANKYSDRVISIILDYLDKEYVDYNGLYDFLQNLNTDNNPVNTNGQIATGKKDGIQDRPILPNNNRDNTFLPNNNINTPLPNNNYNKGNTAVPHNSYRNNSLPTSNGNNKIVIISIIQVVCILTAVLIIGIVKLPFFFEVFTLLALVLIDVILVIFINKPEYVDNNQTAIVNRPISGPVNNFMNAPVNNNPNSRINNPVNRPVNNYVSNPVNNSANKPVNNVMNNQVNRPVNNFDSRPEINPMDKPINNLESKPIINPIEKPVSNVETDSTNSSIVEPVNNLESKPISNVVDKQADNIIDNSVNKPINEALNDLESKAENDAIDAEVDNSENSFLDKPTSETKDNLEDEAEKPSIGKLINNSGNDTPSRPLNYESNYDLNNENQLPQNSIIRKNVMPPLHDNFETVILEDRFPYLIYEDDGINERIEINKNEFKIGRMRGSVDYICENRAVGKFHAVILTKNNEYFIVDLQSKNGTYINGIRIQSNIEHKLKNGDSIMLSDSEFIFKIR